MTSKLALGETTRDVRGIKIWSISENKENKRKQEKNLTNTDIVEKH